MAEGRVFFSATTLADGRVLVAGGFANGDGNSPLASAELYDPTTGDWIATGSMTEPRAGHTATLLQDGTVLVAGGGASPAEATAAAELYDPATGSWHATGTMKHARASHTATLLPDGSVLVAGGGAGASSAGIEGSAEVYVPAKGTWTTTGDLHDPRTLQSAILLNDGKVLVAGGQSPQDTALASAELYDSTGRSWAVTAPMATGRAGHVDALLPDGRVLVAGGVSGGFTGNLTPGEILSATELYDPSARAWRPRGAWRRGASAFVAASLAGGRVLVAAGDTLGNGPLTSAELFDPAGGSWTGAADMIEGRAGQSAASLSDGRVLVVGGEGPRGVGLRTAELYGGS